MNGFCCFVDPVGDVVIRKNTVVRSISSDYISATNEILSSNVFHELVNRRVFPRTKKLQGERSFFLFMRKLNTTASQENGHLIC